MKKMMMIAAAALALCSCGGKKAEKKAAIPFEHMEWTKVAPEEIDFNPFQTVGKDWMALAMGSKEGMNSMTVSWGQCGVLWNKPVFTVYVSSDRYSKKLMDGSKYFTVMAFPDTRKNKDGLVYIGSHSQKDDPEKTRTAGFTVDFTELGTPLINEASLAFECKIIYKEEIKRNLLPDDVRPSYDDMGLHTMYVGEIVNVLKKK